MTKYQHHAILLLRLKHLEQRGLARIFIDEHVKPPVADPL